MKTLAFFFALIVMAPALLASDLKIQINGGNQAEKERLQIIFSEISQKLPVHFRAGLPETISIKIEKLSEHKSIPADLCEERSDKKEQKPFVYGEYNHRTKTLKLHQAVVNELMKGPLNSQKIRCQHKSLYDQSIATIVHELAHALDFNNKNHSRSSEFLQRAGFKKGLLKVKNKNTEAMRPADPYELQSAVEAFAVNAEYYVLDPEFACRRPSMFEYMKSILGEDKHLDKKCTANRTVMMSTTSGFYPILLDPSRVYRIDYLLAAPGKELSSGFGHSMFRIVLCAPEHYDPITDKMIPATPYGKKCLEDRLFHLVVSYRANVEDATLNYLKGLLGGYPSMLFILNFSDVLDEYNRDELRDVVSYPLLLSEKEKLEVLNKVLEDHWNYRGSYKFVTNNCAVESFNLLKNALDRSQLNEYHSLSPKGVLDDLDRTEFVSLKGKTQEMFPARTEPLIQAYNKAYHYRIKGTKKDKEGLLKFISESAASERRNAFERFAETKPAGTNLHDHMVAMKDRLITASSFSVLEQQILRTRMAAFKKLAAELFMNSKDEKIQEIARSAGVALKQNFTDLSRNGYGVPLHNEMLSRREMEEKMAASKETMVDVEQLLRESFPTEFAGIQTINENISVFNRKSLELRKSYREKLENYIHQVLTQLKLDFSGRDLLVRSLSNKADLDKVRDLLDSALVNEKELLDVKLRKKITDLLAE